MLVITGRDKMEEGDCKYCGFVTKYRCLKCESFVCNRNLECSIFASESYPGWKTGERVALCKACDQKEFIVVQDDDQEESINDETNDNETNNDIASQSIVHLGDTMCIEGYGSRN